MKIIHRFGYYLGGFSIGLVLLAFFLRGKKTSCDYGPNARVIKNISIKKKSYSDEALAFMAKNQLDTTNVSNLIHIGSVNFSDSNTTPKDCKIYAIETSLHDEDLFMSIENCETQATILSFSKE